MSRQLFGTDGIRGKAGEPPLDKATAYALGAALGSWAKGRDSSPKVLLGMDTRESGPWLAEAVGAGLKSAGVEPHLGGLLTTPAVAWNTKHGPYVAGVMISASHNPFDDNGIKFFSADGMKLPDAVEHEIEAAMDEPLACKPSRELGRARRVDDAPGRYLEFCKSTFPSRLNLRGMKIVVDCAHGAAYDIAPKLFWELGAEVTAIGVSPNGFNINDEVGATHTATLAAKVKEVGADLGIALDGDGDRLMMCDRTGRVYDGDELLYAVVKDRHATGTLKGGVAGTLMTNFGFEARLKAMGIAFDRAKVGDRYVLEMLIERGWECGGENSGHIICLDKHTTGDGTISALQVLAALARSGEDLAAFTADLKLVPQKLVNVRTATKFDFAKSAPVQAAVKDAEVKLAARGRVLLRASGTEPVIRVMVEGEEGDVVNALAQQIADVVKAEAGRAK